VRSQIAVLDTSDQRKFRIAIDVLPEETDCRDDSNTFTALAIRAATKRSVEDLSRWDFDQGGPLLSSELSIFDIGDLATNPANPEGNRSLITATTHSIVSIGAVPVLLGGDDSVPIPFFGGFEKVAPVTLLQVDAHLDWRDERAGLKHTFSSTMRRASEMPWVERIIQVGLRGIGGSRATDLADARAWGCGARNRRHDSSKRHSAGPGTHSG
jgi:agmatinase